MSLSSNNEIYLMGDFNIDIKAGKLSNTKWKHVIQTNDLHQLIDEPTRVTAHSETIIDHLYTTTPESVKDIHIPKVAVSDHYPIQFTRLTGKSHITSSPKGNDAHLRAIIQSEKKRKHQFFRCLRAANSVVRNRIWPNFKLIQGLMYVIITCKYEKDPIKNNQEKVATPFFKL